MSTYPVYYEIGDEVVPAPAISKAYRIWTIALGVLCAAAAFPYGIFVLTVSSSTNITNITLFYKPYNGSTFDPPKVYFTVFFYQNKDKKWLAQMTQKVHNVPRPTTVLTVDTTPLSRTPTITTSPVVMALKKDTWPEDFKAQKILASADVKLKNAV
ncbi:uncharacterized protein LOC62_06G007833 [Vanrija pseudolonga]|uniref:Uncharacterized protein n=1 Tax=Vanrija pseudolonga TaxID=143232 RepID=A0AAF1BPP2_9TREE|nr:hypothetical protein LOC62_06G007833 [Vanrija pseudolonga]